MKLSLSGKILVTLIPIKKVAAIFGRRLHAEVEAVQARPTRSRMPYQKALFALKFNLNILRDPYRDNYDFAGIKRSFGRAREKIRLSNARKTG